MWMLLELMDNLVDLHKAQWNIREATASTLYWKFLKHTAKTSHSSLVISSVQALETT